MTHDPGPIEPAMRVSFLDNPLKQWKNHDILVDPDAREALSKRDPALFRVRDWPELRDLFEKHDEEAERAKWRTRWRGSGAGICAGLGLTVLGSEVLFTPWTAEAVILPIALGLMTFGSLLGLLDWRILPTRAVWLGHRFWAERLRQLYFQFLLQEHTLAARAMTDNAAFEQLKTLRAEALTEFYHEPGDPRLLIRTLLRDCGNGHVWTLRRWKRPPPAGAATAELDKLLIELRECRIGVQDEYSRKNLGDDIFSAPTRDRLLQGLSDMLLIATIILAVFAWIADLSSGSFLRFRTREWLGIIAMASAIGLTAKLIKDGLRTEAEAARYESYSEAISNVAEDFDRGDLAEKLRTLAELERLSYTEMRSFMVSQHAARFV
jgi:hypothetical protein